MKINDLRTLANYHAAAARNALAASNGMGDCPTGRALFDLAATHADWAEKLNELVSAFETLRPMLSES